MALESVPVLVGLIELADNAEDSLSDLGDGGVDNIAVTEVGQVEVTERGYCSGRIGSPLNTSCLTEKCCA